MPGTPHANVVRSTHGTTTAGQIDTITFQTNVSGAYVIMKVPASGSAGLYVTADGSDPAVAADGTDWVPASAGAYVKLKVEGATDVVKVFSATADSYYVRGV
jgi:hypothetical protein